MKTTPTFVKQQLALYGISIHEWSAAHGFTPSLVYAVLSGRVRGVRGESFRIAVALGLQVPPQQAEVPIFVRAVLDRRGDPT